MNCPYCNIPIELEQINCKILRCGIYIVGSDFDRNLVNPDTQNITHNIVRQIPPHSKEEYVKNLTILFGCGNPLKYDDGVLCKTDWNS